MKVCIFDLDGTLVNSLGDVTASVNHALVNGGYPPVTQERVFELIGNGVSDLLMILLPEDKKTPEEMHRLRDTYYFPYYEAHMTDRTTVYPQVPEMLRGLRANGWKLALLSNKTDQFAHHLADTLFPGLFDYVRGAVDGFPLKPDPAVGKLVTEHFGVAPENCVMVGDSHFDIDFARVCGFESVGVDWGFAEPDELKNANAHIIVSEAMQIVDALGRADD